MDPPGLAKLMADTGGKAKISVHPANGAARFVRMPAGVPGSLVAGARREASAQEKSAAFFNQHSRIFGIHNPGAELQLVGESADGKAAGKHLTYKQYYNGVPVFAGYLKTHFDANGDLRAVNGNVVPNISLNTTPARSAEQAAALAVSKIIGELAPREPVSARDTSLVVFQAGLAKGVDLGTHLAWRVEVGNGGSVREFVFVDAHSGKVVDQITGTPDALNRRAYDGAGLPTVPPSYPGSPFWVEGQPFPTGVTEADNMILASQETYDVFFKGFGLDSYDGAGHVMDSIFNRGYGCPNASWNGTFISFCPGFTTDDVTGHEWAHAYTEYSHGLIYQWQPGALNESYSDIWGEVVDRLNSRGTDTPFGVRTAGLCSSFSPPKGVLTVNSPAAIAGDYAAQSAQFGPALTATGITADVVVGLDGVGVSSDACTALINGAEVTGKIALVDRGVCNFTVKVKNAQNAGAIGVIVANNASTGLPGMGGADPTITIPSLGVTLAAGNAIKAQLGSGVVNATLHSTAGATDNSVRWLMGEDVTPGGAIRDMWSPNCYSNPDRVTDTAYYVCSTADNGGVHTNSGVPNKAFALLVDGGSFNGQTIAALGLNKASHIYYRAQSVYQGPATDFAEHADAIEQSCTDLVGVNLADLSTGAPSGEMLTAADCAEVAKATLATEMRTPPSQCNFTALLAKNPPDRCGAGTTQANVFATDFETDPASLWTATHETPSATFTARNWQWVNSLPNGRSGSAFFGPDPDIGACTPASDESGVLHLDSPPITVPEGAIVPLLTFDHWVATEPGWDGGNLKVSVNGGPWTLVVQGDITYNPYNLTMVSAAGGNTSPLAGQRGYSGTDGGSVAGSWGRSHVNLANYAVPGDSVILRWDLGSDGCGGRFGWYVDDVTVYACPSSDAPTVSINSVSVTEGSAKTGFNTMTFTVSLSHASAGPVQVDYKTVLGGTASPGKDYLPTEGTLVFPPLTLTRTVTVRIVPDFATEADEYFRIILRYPLGVSIGAGEGAGTIVNDD